MMLRLILLSLLVWQSLALALTAKAWRLRHRDFWQWRWRLLAAPAETQAAWCAAQAGRATQLCHLDVAWLSDGESWEDVCASSAKAYRHRAARYWRLRVECRLAGPWLSVSLPVTEAYVFR